MDPEFTISDLAREAGMTVRTLRDYNERGLLPPPQMRGRTGFYGGEHLNRVRIISRLLERGITLNGVRGLLEAWDRGDDLADVLGVAATSAVAPSQTSGRTSEKSIAATDLAEKYREVPNGLARVVMIGLYEPVDAVTYRVTSGELVEMLDRLVADGMPVGHALDEVDQLRTDCDHIARQFVDLFDRTAVRSFRRSDRTGRDVDELTERLAVARVEPGRMASALIDQFIGRYLERVARDLPGRS